MLKVKEVPSTSWLSDTVQDELPGITLKAKKRCQQDSSYATSCILFLKVFVVLREDLFHYNTNKSHIFPILRLHIFQ